MYINLLKSFRRDLNNLNNLVRIPCDFRHLKKEQLITIYDQVLENRKTLVALDFSFSSTYAHLLIDVDKDPTHYLDYTLTLYDNFRPDLRKTKILYEICRKDIVRALY